MLKAVGSNWLLAFAATMIGVVWVAIVLRLGEHERDAIQGAEHNLANLALAFDEGLSRSITALDQTIIAVRTEHARRGLTDGVKNLIEVLGKADPMIASIGIADPAGDLVFAINPSPDAPAQVNVADRPHFKVHLEPGPDRLFIGPPFVARVSGRWSVFLSRRIERADGSFGGAVIATIDAAKLADFYKSIDIGARGTVTVLGLDGVARVRVDTTTGARFGDDLRGIPALGMAATRPVGSYRITSRIDGQERIFAYRKMRDAPLLVVVGAATDEILRGASARQQGLYLAGGALTLTILAFSALIHVHARRTRLRELNARLETDVEQRTAELAASEQRFAGFARIGADWLWETDAEDRFTFFSGDSARFGIDFQGRLGTTQRAGALQDPENLARLAPLEQAVRQRQPYRDVQYRLQFGSERPRWCSVSGEPRFDSAGAFAGYRGVARDVSDLVEAQEAAAAKNRILEAVFKAMPDAVQVIDADRRDVASNDQLFAMWNIDRTAYRAAAEPILHFLTEIARRGDYGPGDPETLARQRLARLEETLTKTGTLQYARQLANGRWIETRLTATEGGGRVALYRDITDAKLREQELERQSTLLRTIFASMGEGICVFDKDLRLAVWNQRFLDLTGIDPGVAKKGAALRDILVSQARAGEFGACDPEAEADRRIEELWSAAPAIRERLRPNGRTIELRRDPIAGGGFVTVYVDITERKAIEQALRELNATLELRVDERTAALAASERRLARAQQIAKVGHWVWSGPAYTSWTAGKIEFSAAAAAIFGVAPEELTVPDSEYLERFVHPDDRARVRTSFTDYKERRKKGVPLEYRILRPDGAVRWIVEITEATMGDPDQPTEVIGTIHDITDRKEAEQELAATRASMHDAIESINHGLLLYDRDDRLVVFNHHFMDHFSAIADIARVGIRFEDMFREAIARGTIVVPEGQDTEAYIARRVAQHRRADGQIVVRHLDDGRIIHVSERRSRDGGIVATGVDVTEQAKVEHQLREAQKMEAIGKLTGGLAHDFNNYLSVIIGNLDFLREDVAGDPRALRQVETALRGATRAADLTRSLLSFARRQPLTPKVVNPAQSIAETVRLLDRTLGERITTKFIAEPKLWRIEVDQDQFNSSIVNLANNARDAMPQGGSLTIALRNVVLDDDYAASNPGAVAGEFVLIEVSDTGTGMTPEAQASAFEPFFTTKGPGHGTGLGLSMVYGFVKQSGGHIQIYSEVNYGTTVRIYLPRAAERAPASVAAAPRSDAMPRGGETVLVVEDNENVRETAVEQLTDLGYRVIEADSGDTALEFLQEPDQPIDLLFTDIIMPGKLDGYALARTATAERPDLKVLLTSGFPGTTFDDSGKHAPDLPLLLKPYRKAELARAVRAALDA